MRTTPPFDPRVQPAGMYVGGPPPHMYMQPMMHGTTPPPTNFTPLPQMPYASPEYMMHAGQHQMHPQYNENQIKMARPQNQQGHVQNDAHKQQSANTTEQNTLQVYKGNKNQGGYEQNQEQQYQNYQQGQEGEQQQQMKNQQIIMFWEHKFYTILERFQLIFEKVETFRIDFQHLNEELRAVDSEQEWNQAKDHHEDYMEQLQQFTQQLAGVINENANLVEQTEHDTNDQLIWKDRYFELFEGYKAMQQQLFEMKQNSRAPDGPDPKMTELMANYRQLERQYTHTVNQLNQFKQNKERNQHEMSQDKTYREKLDYALREAEKYKDMLEQLSKQNEDLDATISRLKSEQHQMQQMMKNAEEEIHKQTYQQYNRAVLERDQQINMLNKQLHELSQKYNFLVETHNNLQSRVQDDQPRIKGKFNQLQSILQTKNKQILQLKRKNHQIQLKQKSTQSTSEQYQRQLKIRSTQLQQRNNQVQKMKKEIANAVNVQRNQSQNQLNVLRREFEGKTKKLESEYEQKIADLKKKLRKKQQQVQNTSLLNIKIQSFEKKNKMLLQEIENLNKQLNSKEKQSIQLKRISYSQDKVKQLQYQYHFVLQEKEQLNATLVQKNFELDNMQTQINQFESRIKDLGQKTKSSSSKPLMIEIQQLNNLIQIKQSDINKLKANLGLKDAQIKQLEGQSQRNKNALIKNQKNYEREKDALSENIRSLERRNQQNQKKMRDLQYEFGSIMKKNLEDQIKNLRLQNQSRQENITRLQAQQLELRSRLSHYERVRATHSGDLDELTLRIKDLQASKADMIRKVQNSFRDVKKKEKENKQLIDNAKALKDNIIRLQNQIAQNEKLIKQKDKVIDNLEGQLLVTNSSLTYITEQHDNLRLRRRDEKDLLNKQSDELRRKIFEYEHLNGSKKEFKQKFSSQITKIQNYMIEQLKQQKQFLKSQLSAALQQLGQLPTFEKRPGSSRKSRASQGIDYIQKRLFDFNGKLDQIILKNRQLNNKSSFSSFGNNIQNWNSSRTPQNQSRVENRESQEQIKHLKSEIKQLRQYISKLQVEAGGQTIRYNPKNQMIYMEQQKNYNERIEFYQKQTTQLQGRIQHLIKVNVSLKERVDSLLKGQSSNSAVSFYKEQLALSQESIENLNNKIKKLLDQNRNLKSNTSDTTTKMCRGYEDKIFECENKIFALERKVNGLQLEKTKTQNQKAGIQKSLQLAQTELYTLKSTVEKQSQNHQKNNKQLSEQVTSYENQINELLGRVRLLQSQNSRLSQAMYTPYSQQHILMNTPVKGTPAKVPQKK